MENKKSKLNIAGILAILTAAVWSGWDALCFLILYGDTPDADDFLSFFLGAISRIKDAFEAAFEFLKEPDAYFLTEFINGLADFLVIAACIWIGIAAFTKAERQHFTAPFVIFAVAFSLFLIIMGAVHEFIEFY